MSLHQMPSTTSTGLTIPQVESQAISSYQNVHLDTELRRRKEHALTWLQLRSERAFRNVKALVGKCQSKVTICWPVSEQVSIATWLSLLAALLVGAFGLRYAYNQQELAYQAMKLVKWTAKKDFLELCRETETKNTTTTPDCARALLDPFPAPPFVDLEPSNRLHRRILEVLHKTTTCHSPSRSHGSTPAIADDANLLVLSAVFVLLLICMCLRRQKILSHLVRGLSKVSSQSFRETTPLPAQFGHLRGPPTTFKSAKPKAYFGPPRDPIISLPEASIQSVADQLSTALPSFNQDGLRNRGNNISHAHENNLWEAVRSGNYDLVEAMLADGADVNETQLGQDTPLMVAVAYGRRRIMRLLLSVGAQINDARLKDTTAIPCQNAPHTAVVATSHSPSMIHDLLQNDDTVVPGHETPLYSAAAKNNHKVVILILMHGADPDQASGYAGSALQAAALSGHLASVKALVQGGADLNINNTPNGIGMSPLHAAVSQNHALVVDYLLDQGARISMQPMENRNALRNAIVKKNTWIIEKLLTHGLRLRCSLNVSTQLKMVEDVRAKVADGDDEGLYQYVKAEMFVLEAAQIRMSIGAANQVVEEVRLEIDGESDGIGDLEGCVIAGDDVDVFDEDEMFPFDWGL